LPLYIFCGEELLCAKLRRSNIDPSEGTLPEVERIVEAIRGKWPEAEIILRADSGFARERIMKWCEDNGVDYVFGLAKNSRLKDRVGDLMAEVEQKAEEIGGPVRRFKDFFYRTLDSWSKKRRVVAKAEYLTDKANPRFVVTSLSEEKWGGLQETEWARAQIWTLRSKLLKIGALMKVSVRRVFFEISKHYPKKGLFAEVLSRLQAATPTVTGATA